MPGLYDDDDEYGQDEQSGPKGLRSKLAAVEKEKADLAAKLAELTETNATLAKQVKSTTLRQALQDAGVDPKYARFAERDEVEATPESVAKWVEESKDVYAFLSAKTDAAPSRDAVDSGDEGDDEEQVDQLDDSYIQAILAGQQVESNGRPGGTATVTDILAGVDPSKFKSEAELDAFIKALNPPSAYRD